MGKLFSCGDIFLISFSYYYIIAVKITETMIIQDVSNYKQKDLKQYDPNVKDTPYIAAVLTPKEFASMTEFDLGNGKVTKTLTVRRKRLARATAEEYNNQPLDPDSTYSAFIRVVSSTVCSRFSQTMYDRHIGITSPSPPPLEFLASLIKKSLLKGRFRCSN